ncbi:Sucrose-6-phosphate hydrolase (EC [Citrobacter europaeus]|uniref:glycoside hydrolase family 32 protein n=1 Tax=Citrobacter europaeus TaxID=1914243 RepID=UPI00088B9B69|nr:glycoside hydrolase family 32 protein [Citrobacter europaeus]UBI16953.1 family 43 glycosylhydrolase [Citrobacter europaeus]CAD7564018.1 Sucrose-6-phosphate hydrolase (EC [Citrobacter europaeus]
MKKIILVVSAALLALSLINMPAWSQPSKETLHNKSISYVNDFFPRVEGSFIGDPMPVYNDGEFDIFYLNDVRGGSDLGVHAIHLLSSTNLYNYQNHSEVIPYVNDVDDPELLLGTGSIVKVGDTWHAWYTAHNENVFPVESIMHATSKDRLHWVKHPQDTILPGDNYRGNDFRDPHVVWVEEKKEYWMLITTRRDGRGVIARYSSTDLKNWEDRGVFFDNDTITSNSNLECPTLVFFNGRWYLSFSDQWPLRLTQYRVADNPDGPWRKMDNYAVDGSGFYAGKLALKNDRLFVFGWIPTKAGSSDSGNIDWAGNLVVHELIADEQGQLKSILSQELQTVINDNPGPVTTLKSGKMLKTATQFGPLQSAVYPPLPKRGELSATIDIPSAGMVMSFGLIDDRVSDAKLNVVFNKSKGKVYFFNAPLASIHQANAESWVNVSLDEKIELRVLLQDSVAVFYINNKAAFSTRMYSMPEKPWSISLPQNDNFHATLKIKEII